MSAARSFESRYGPWALVTGAARGLGAEFSRQIAAQGVNLALVDLLADELAEVAREIRDGTGREIRTIATDLSQPSFIETIREQTEGLEVGLLVSNAAFVPVGLFLEQTLDENLRAVAVNVRAPLILLHEFAAEMVARRRGGIILLSSESALHGTAYVANYAATKAYNLILAESLWQELRAHDVDVLGLMPGITRTPGYLSSKPRLDRGPRIRMMEPQPTVAEALEALGRKPSWIAGAGNRWTALVTGKLMPRKKLIALVGRTMRAWYER